MTEKDKVSIGYMNVTEKGYNEQRQNTYCLVPALLMNPHQLQHTVVSKH